MDGTTSRYKKEKPKPMPPVDLELLKSNPIFKLMIEAHLLTEQGFRIGGMGRLIELQDKTNRNLYFIEQKIGGSYAGGSENQEQTGEESDKYG